MHSFGETLRQARLDRGVSLADAERDTRIRRRYLEALEAEDLAALPAAVYTRGFIRTYAEYLGLNPDAMVDLYAPPRRQEEAPSLRPPVPHLSIPREVPLRPLLSALGAIAALIFLYFLWTQYQAAAAAVRELDNPAARSGTATVPPRVPTPNPIAVASPPPSPTPTPQPTPSPTPVVDGILVEFRTTARVYVEAAVDGQGVLAETLPAGAQRSLPLGRDAVIMRVSNGSAVEITLNGRRQDPVDSQSAVELSWRR